MSNQKKQNLINIIIEFEKKFLWIKNNEKNLHEHLTLLMDKRLAQIESYLRMKENTPVDMLERLLDIVESDYNVFFKAHQKKNRFLDTIISLSWIIFFILCIHYIIGTSHIIATNSMIPTVYKDEKVFLSKISFGISIPFMNDNIVETGKPERGDIIVFADNKNDNKLFVKRVIGIPGDEITILEDLVFVNGKTLKKRSIKPVKMTDKNNKKKAAYLYSEINNKNRSYHVIYFRKKADKSNKLCKNCNKKIKVEEEKYFVMGDNRDQSIDSRHLDTISIKQIIGKPLLIWLPLSNGKVNSSRFVKWIK